MQIEKTVLPPLQNVLTVSWYTLHTNLCCRTVGACLLPDLHAADSANFAYGRALLRSNSLRSSRRSIRTASNSLHQLDHPQLAQFRHNLLTWNLHVLHHHLSIGHFVSGLRPYVLHNHPGSSWLQAESPLRHPGAGIRLISAFVHALVHVYASPTF